MRSIILLFGSVFACACASERGALAPLEHYTAHLGRYRVWAWHDGHWQEASGVEDGTVELAGGGRVLTADLESWVAAYPNGEVIELGPRRRRLPDEVRFISDSAPVSHTVPFESFDEGNHGFVAITFGDAGAHPETADNYSTTLTNTGDVAWRVTRFGGYTRARDGWELSTITGGFFTAEQFRAWYGMAEEEYVQPGQSLVDYNNYGGPGSAWIYEVELEGGDTFRAGGVSPRRGVFAQLFGL